MDLLLQRLPSPIGTILLVSDGETVRAVDFEDYEARMRTLLRRYAGDHELREGRAPRAVTSALKNYFSGDYDALDSIRVETGGTAFQQRVWRALRDIPAGGTLSYGALAAKLGMPKASRAVGLANGANPICIVLPCHRVIGADGSLTGYGGGLPRKKWLLAHEGVRLKEAA